MKAYKQNWVDFTAIPNDIFRHALSLKAVGLYAYIANKPDGWNFSVRGAMSQLKDGEGSIRSAIAELEEAGFLKREKARKSSGVFGGSIWYIYGTPLKKPKLDNPTLDNSSQVITKRVMTKREGRQPARSFFDEQVEAEKYLAELTPDFIAKFLSPRANESDVRASAKKCFAWHLKEGKVPHSWKGALHYWLSNEDWSRYE